MEHPGTSGVKKQKLEEENDDDDGAFDAAASLQPRSKNENEDVGDDYDSNAESLKTTGAAKKMADLKRKIKNQKKKIQNQENIIQEKNAASTSTAPTDTMNAPELLALERQLSALKDEFSGLERQLSALKISFYTGKYYAGTHKYWKIEAATATSGDIWQLFGRASIENMSDLLCRSSTSGGELGYTTPYDKTKAGAEDPFKECVLSNTSRCSASSQNNKEIRDKVWPTDIFGNKASDQPIAHLLPAGINHSKQWVDIAAVAVGLKEGSDITARKKAFYGLKNDKKEGRSARRVPDTGAVHFVSNKIRLQKQEKILDGDYPSALLVPVMTCEEAKKWKGKGYKAVFLAGHPLGVNSGYGIDIPKVYRDAGLNEEELLNGESTRDAADAEVESARTLLSHAIAALADLIAKIPDSFVKNEIDESQQDPLLQARKIALEKKFLVPASISTDESSKQRRPACLVEFGAYNEGKRHPAPDPVLLVFKAANVWGRLTNNRMLANGLNWYELDDVSSGDIAAEEAFLEARFAQEQERPETWMDLARGLGQPHGYTVTGDNY